MTTNDKSKVTYILFEERIGECFISMCLDKRHAENVKNYAYPLCIRFHIYGSRYYYSLGEKCTIEELKKLSKSTGNREKRIGLESTFERRIRLQEVF